MSIPPPPVETLEIIVVGGNNMKDNNRMLRQLPYIVLSYAGRQFRTSCLTNGGRNPRFNKKLKVGMVDGFRAIAVTAWSRNVFASDSFIGSGRIDITNALKDGFDDHTCRLLGTSGRALVIFLLPVAQIQEVRACVRRDVGEVKLMVHFSNPQKYRMAAVATAPQDTADSQRPLDAPSPLPPTTGYPPPSPYHQYRFYPPSPLHFASSTSTVPPSSSVPPSASPSAPYPPPDDPSLSHNAPPFQMPSYHPSASKGEYYGPPDPK